MNPAHWCKDATIPVCAECGRRWEFVTVSSDGSRTYTSAKVVAKYAALYGDPPKGFFVEVRA